MTLDEFSATLNERVPPPVSMPLQALWHAANENWDEAHRIAHDVKEPTGAWVHAYLHRQEGDLGNARYWYQRARQPEATDSLEAEWARIVAALLEL